MNNDSTSAAKSTEVEIKTPEVNVEYANVSSEEDSQKEKVTRMWSFLVESEKGFHENHPLM